jgi:hypothetical protein
MSTGFQEETQARMDVMVIMRYLLRILGLSKYGQKELTRLIDGATKELLASRGRANRRIH